MRVLCVCVCECVHVCVYKWSTLKEFMTSSGQFNIDLVQAATQPPKNKRAGPNKLRYGRQKNMKNKLWSRHFHLALLSMYSCVFSYLWVNTVNEFRMYRVIVQPGIQVQWVRATALWIIDRLPFVHASFHCVGDYYTHIRIRSEKYITTTQRVSVVWICSAVFIDRTVL